MSRTTLNLTGCLMLTALAACGGGGGGQQQPAPQPTPQPTPQPAPTLATGPAACTSGTAIDFSCGGISLHKRMPFATLGGSAGNDVWGWHDANSGKEYALVGMTTGTAFVDVSDPDNPVALGTLPTATVASGWRDIKVYRDHAYIVADGAGAHGMQVFDLKRLRGASGPQTFSADFHYTQVANSHNIAINEATGFAYIVGTDTCNEGLHMVDLSSPANPAFAGCHALSETHDTQCVTYHGPDTEHLNKEICFSSNKDHVEIVDVTDKSAPVSLATLVYPSLRFVHQGWLSEDQAYFFVGDELDELNFAITTRTIVLDVSDLDAPAYDFSYESANSSTDHNLYVRGNRIYEGNYASGLRVLDIDDVAGGSISEIAFFDTYPQSNAAGFDGVWSVYPYLPSGTLIVNDRENGLFLLTMNVATAFATVEETAFEREVVALDGVVTGSPASVNWVQTGGTPAAIASSGAVSTTVTLPELSAPEWLSFDLVAGGSRRAVDTVHIHVSTYPPVSSVLINDPVLRQCVDDLAAAGSFDDVGPVTSLNCADVSDVSGLEVFPNLTELVLSGGSLSGVSSLSGLGSLETLDLSGYTSLSCQELEALEAALDPSILFSKGTTCRVSAVADLGGTGFDSAIDSPRRQIYISLPSRQEIVVASLDTTQIVERIRTPGEPRGIDLSLDGTRLFAALRDTDSVIEIDLDTKIQRSIPLNAQALHSATHDVVEAQPDRLFVSANPGIRHGPANVVQVLLDQGDAVSPVADERIMREDPRLTASADGQFLYIGEGFSPNSLYKLSLADPLAGIVLEDESGALSGTDKLALNSTGTHLALRSGQVVRTDSLTQEDSLPVGTPATSESGDQFVINTSGNSIGFFDSLTRDPVRTEVVDCYLEGPADLLHSFNEDQAFALVYRESLCLAVDVPLSTTLDPYPELHFTDLALEACARETAEVRGWTSAADFVSLDCSASPDPIRSVHGIEALVNLTELDISGSEVLELDAVARHGGISRIIARNAIIARLQPALSGTALASLDVTGSPNVSCEDLDSLAASGVSVSADQCAGFLALDLEAWGADIEVDEVGNRAYVSAPVPNSIFEVDLATFSVVRTLVTSGRPDGIDLSEDRSTLYVALNDMGSVAYIDVATGVEQVVDLNAELGHVSAHDVVEISTDRILVSASPALGNDSYIVEVRRDLGNAAQRVANGNSIRSWPEFAVAPDGSSVYLREDFPASAIYKLDATKSDLPIIAQSGEGLLNDTSHIRISPNGSLLATRSGQLISTSNVNIVGQLSIGSSDFSPDGAFLIADGRYFNGVTVYDVPSRRIVGERLLGCASWSSNRLVARADGGVVALRGEWLCSVETVPY